MQSIGLVEVPTFANVLDLVNRPYGPTASESLANGRNHSPSGLASARASCLLPCCAAAQDEHGASCSQKRTENGPSDGGSAGGMR